MKKFSAIGMVALTLAAATSAVSAEVKTVLDSGVAGPTVLLVNSPASAKDVSGSIAMKQVSRWTLTKGKVVSADEKELKDAVASVKPAAIVMLDVNAKTAADAPLSSLTAKGIDGTALLEKLNKIHDPNVDNIELGKKETTQPVGDTAVVVELTYSTNKGSAPAGERTRIYRHAVNEVLAAQGMTTTSPWMVMDEKSPKIKVAVYAGGGSTNTPGLSDYPAALEMDAKDIEYTYIGPVELARQGSLDPFNVVIFCGGSGSGQAKSIGEAGAVAVKDFVKKGGGYVSSCAGSYLATSGYPWSLKLIDADTVDREHWARGVGEVKIELTDEGKKILGNYQGLQEIHYANGPLLGKAKDSGGLSPYTVLAWYRGDMAKNVPGGVMPNTPCMIAGDYGQGRVLCFSAHPEYTNGLKEMVARAVKWVAKKPVESGAQ